jgi:predicted PurR-regulated permease PerM
VVYLVLLLVFLGMTTGLGFAITQGVIQLGAYLGDLSVELPSQILALSSQTVTIGPWQIDLARVNLEPILTEVAAALRPLLSQTGNLIASLARATASAVSLIFLALILGYYMLIDFGALDDALVAVMPPAYRYDMRVLIDEVAYIWHAFLRGQSILALIIGTAVSVLLTLLGVQFSLVLGVIAGLMEFVPMFGPLLTAIVAVIVAFFQPGNWLGISALAYATVVLVVLLIVQQIENNILVPRIIGKSLKMHPLTVLIAVLAGGMMAGVLGLLLAAPTAATLRLCFGYAYRKTVGLDAWPLQLLSSGDEGPPRPGLFRRIWSVVRARWVSEDVSELEKREE